MGEISHVWDRNLIDNRICGCGLPFKECGVWSGVMKRAFGGVDGVDAREMARMRDNFARTRHLPLAVATRKAGRSPSPALGRYLESLEKLYGAIQSHTGCKVIVDSSKLPSYGHILTMARKIDLYVVHLVRDPRAVAYSWLRKKLQPDTGQLFRRHSVVESALVWDAWNAAVEAIWGRSKGRYLRIRYEDFVADPGPVVTRIIDMVDEAATPDGLIEGSRVRLGVTHTTSGNPSRLKTGDVELRPDQEWAIRMKPWQARSVAALSWPLLKRYGYAGDASPGSISGRYSSRGTT